MPSGITSHERECLSRLKAPLSLSHRTQEGQPDYKLKEVMMIPLESEPAAKINLLKIYVIQYCKHIIQNRFCIPYYGKNHPAQLGMLEKNVNVQKEYWAPFGMISPQYS